MRTDLAGRPIFRVAKRSVQHDRIASGGPQQADPTSDAQGDSVRPQPRTRSYSGRRRSGLSNSSMLTSLKVITRTCLTKRAGRYMSHTHESDMRNSK